MENMNIPEIFKYNSLISIPLFSIIALLLIKKTRGFSFSKSTISKSILLLKETTYQIIFRLNFVVKAALDFGFIWYLIHRFTIPINSFLGLSLMASVIFFGLLAYFTEGKHKIIHRMLVYGNGLLWGISQILLAQFTKDTFFIVFTNATTTVAILIAFWFLFAKKTNVFIQITCVSLLYSWLLLFVFRYL